MLSLAVLKELWLCFLADLLCGVISPQSYPRSLCGGLEILPSAKPIAETPGPQKQTGPAGAMLVCCVCACHMACHHLSTLGWHHSAQAFTQEAQKDACR